MQTAVNIALQVFAGLLVVLIVYYLSLRLLRQDALAVSRGQAAPSPRVEVTVLNGYVESTVVAQKSYNTVNPAKDNYVNIPNSFNRRGGAQLSYSLWVFVDDPDKCKHVTLFARGDVRRYTAAFFAGWKAKAVERAPPTPVVDATGARSATTVKVAPDHVVTAPVVFAPAVGFMDRYDEIGVVFNTVQTPFNIAVISPAATRGFDATRAHDVERRDALKLIAHKWALFTVVIEDSTSVNDFDDGVVVRFYLNDVLYHTARMPGTLRGNTGPLHLFPDGGVPGLRIGNLKYFNYAIGQERVKELYDAGPPKFYSPDVQSRADLGEPLFLSEYNKLDLYS